VPFREKLAKRARKAGLTPSFDVISGLEAYFCLLAKWNQKFSLTALRVDEPDDEAIDRLLIEPLLAAKYVPNPEAQVIDIGSGGGSPAIPLKITSSAIRLTMVESKTRKAAFLREAVGRLALDNTQVEAVRFEALLDTPRAIGSADIVTIRAVRVTQEMLMGLERLLKSGGAIFLFGTRLSGTQIGVREPFSGNPTKRAPGLLFPPSATQLPAERTLQVEATHSLLPHLNSFLAILRSRR